MGQSKINGGLLENGDLGFMVTLGVIPSALTVYIDWKLPCVKGHLRFWELPASKSGHHPSKCVMAGSSQA